MRLIKLLFRPITLYLDVLDEGAKPEEVISSLSDYRNYILGLDSLSDEDRLETVDMIDKTVKRLNKMAKRKRNH